MARRAYARGRRAWGHDARTGERVLLRDLVKDGHTGLPVTRESYEPKHPQERAPEVFDPQVLRRPSPDRDRPPYVVIFPTAPWDALHQTYPPLVAIAVMGTITAEHQVGDIVYEADVYQPGVYE